MKTKLLVIEDTESIREEMAAILDFEGYEVLTAANGRAGVDLASTAIPDLVISDIMMPELDGRGVLKALRENPATAAIPVLFLTACASREDMRAGMDLGADDYLTKPFNAPTLLKALRTRLAKKAAITDGVERALHGRFVQTMPHEFRTALHGILGFGRLIEQEGSTLRPEELRTMAGCIVSSGERLERTVQNFLLCSRLASTPQNQVVSGTVADPATALSTSLRTKAAREKRVDDLTVSLAPAGLPIPESDLEKIVNEIVDNAFKFSKLTTPISVTGRTVDDKYQFAVTDQGRGMTREQIDSIDAYRQFDRGRYEQQGCGLGLYIARRLTELYGGKLLVESGIGKGTTVRIELPLALPGATLANSTARP